VNAGAHHSAMLARAVVVCGAGSFAAPLERDAGWRMQRWMFAVQKDVFGEAGASEESSYPLGVARLAAVGRCHQCEVSGSRTERPGRARLDERHRLKGLGGGAHIRGPIGVADARDEAAACVHYGYGPEMGGFDRGAPREGDEWGGTDDASGDGVAQVTAPLWGGSQLVG